MKSSIMLLSFLLLLTAQGYALASTPTVAAVSKIVSVTVFADRAQVTRSARLSLKAGANLIAFEGLPQLMDEDSLRVEGKGSGLASITGITVKKVFLKQIKEKRILELQEEMTAVQRKIESIEARRKALASQRAFIDSLRVGWGERISKELGAARPTVAEMGEAVKFVGEGITKLEEQLYDAEAARKPLLDQLAALKMELEQSRTEGMKEVRSALVAVQADRSMDFILDLSYLVSQASWQPAYDVRLAADGKNAELAYRGQVWQRTGEDWPGVKLSLSTASPEVGGAPPELSPWQISFYEPPRPIYYQSRALKGAPEPSPVPAGQWEQETAAAQSALEQMERARPVTAQVAEGQTSVLFNVREPVDVPADGTRSGSIIAMEKVPVTAEFVAVPKLSPRVYLRSEVVNKTPYPLLSGQVSVFNDNVFTGKTHLKTVSSGEKFDLYFGADEQIKVKREVAKVGKKAGLLGQNSVSYRTSVEVQNFKQNAVTVSLLDQLPIAANAEIKVTLEDAAPEPDERRQDGTLVWKVALAPGEKRKLTYDIVIGFPKDRELTGVE